MVSVISMTVAVGPRCLTHQDGIRLFTAPSLASTVFLHATKTPTAEQPDTKDEEETTQPAEGTEVTGQQKKALMKMLRSMIGKAAKRSVSRQQSLVHCGCCVCLAGCGYVYV